MSSSIEFYFHRMWEVVMQSVNELIVVVFTCNCFWLCLDLNKWCMYRIIIKSHRVFQFNTNTSFCLKANPTYLEIIVNAITLLISLWHSKTEPSNNCLCVRKVCPNKILFFLLTVFKPHNKNDCVCTICDIHMLSILKLSSLKVDRSNVLPSFCKWKHLIK